MHITESEIDNFSKLLKERTKEWYLSTLTEERRTKLKENWEERKHSESNVIKEEDGEKLNTKPKNQETDMEEVEDGLPEKFAIDIEKEKEDKVDDEINLNSTEETSEEIITPSINTVISDLLIDTIGEEFNAFLFYDFCSSWCYSKGYTNAAKTFLGKSMKNLNRIHKLQEFLSVRGVVNLLSASEKTVSFTDMVDLLNQSNNIETALYNKYDEHSRLISQIDLFSFDFLQEFRSNQNDCMVKSKLLLDKIKKIDSTSNLEMTMFIDKFF